MTYSINRRTRIPSIYNPTTFDKLFEDLLNFDDLVNVKNTYPFDMVETTDKNGKLIKTELIFALAGIPKDKIDIKVEDGVLSISVDKYELVEENVDSDTDVKVVHRGISTRSSSVRFKLNDVAVDDITSKYENGLLTITLPAVTKPVKAINID